MITMRWHFLRAHKEIEKNFQPHCLFLRLSTKGYFCSSMDILPSWGDSHDFTSDLFHKLLLFCEFYRKKCFLIFFHELRKIATRSFVANFCYLWVHQQITGAIKIKRWMCRKEGMIVQEFMRWKKCLKRIFISTPTDDINCCLRVIVTKGFFQKKIK